MGDRKTKSGTVAERVVWMTRTSDVLGSHVKTDLESYLTLIRRKIQEKCSTTAELIAQIRRFKIGESAHVTPNEFRFTLIKFGIILPQVLVDRIFNVFDSDRSGTMDFDEFATWIMNSEFRPSLEGGPAKLINDQIESPQQKLQRKLRDCINAHPRVFRDMKEQVSFLEFISEANRVSMPLTEREARNIFQLLDPKDEGFVEAAAIVIWATTGRVDRSNSRMVREEATLQATAAEITDTDSLRRLIKKVIGHNTRQLENAFSHIKMGQGTKLPFEEFRRCLLNGGVGKNLYDMKQLFLSLGGKSEGLADVDLFFTNIAAVPFDPSTEVSAKRAPTAVISTARADRHLRDALRKCFKEVKVDIESEDKLSEGFITPEALYRILVKRCMALSFEDFRFVVQQINKEPGTNRIDYNHFFHAYNPALSHHQLNGLSTLKNYGDESPKRSSKGHHHHHHPHHNTHHQASPKHSGGGMSLSASLPAFKFNESIAALSLTNPRSTITQDDSELGMFTSTPTSNTATAGMNSNPELRRIWQGVLRECHRVDPERSGQVNRTAFIAALEKADLSKNMTAEAMNKLADQYTLSNGLVNYLLLFRSFLNSDKRSTTAVGVTRMNSLPALTNGGGSTGALNNTFSLPAGPVHPWEFGYTREKHPDHPYWHSAASLPKSTTMQMKVSMLPSAAEKSADELNDQEKSLLLGQFNNMVLLLCNKCYKLFLPSWRVLRSNLKKQQVGTQKGSILTANFITILEAEGILLSKTELGLIVKNFRGYGTQDLVRFDDFLRVCMLVKDHFK